MRLAESHAHCGAAAVHRMARRFPPGCGLAVNRVAWPVTSSQGDVKARIEIRVVKRRSALGLLTEYNDNKTTSPPLPHHDQDGM